MSGLIFDEQSMIDGNIFKFEQRLKSHTNRYVENGALLTKYWNIRDSAVTVDRGMKTIDELFGHKSPLKFNKILNFPVYGFGQANPTNTDEANIEDINVEGQCIIQPSTLVPHPNDFFIINHLEMKGIFQITDVENDSMKAEGFYRVKYRLHSTSDEIIENLNKQTVETYHCDLNSIGSDMDPIIRETDYVKKIKIQRMINKMIQSYRALFYNERHNCFLFFDQQTGMRLFDMCGNEFMAKNSIMNDENSTTVIILHEKIRDRQSALFYNNSVYNWIEMDCPKNLIQKFYYMLNDEDCYPDSSFSRWNEGDIQVMQPLSLYQAKINLQEHSFFDDIQLKAFDDESKEPTNEYEKLMYKFINGSNNLSIDDISLLTADSLLSSIRTIDVFLYTPILIYIIRKILRMC